MRRFFSVFALTLCIVRMNCCCGPDAAPIHPTTGYFDGHNHNYSGILPYYAYADLPAYIADPNNPRAVSPAKRLALWEYLLAHMPKETVDPVSPSNRYAPGAIATLLKYRKYPKGLADAEINAALERVLTTTPWTEFDSAYAFRSMATGYTAENFFGNDDAGTNKALCDASILTLALTDTTYSEQFISFIGGWSFKQVSGHPYSSKLDNVMCFIREPQKLEERLRGLGKPVPIVKVLLLTATAPLGQNAGTNTWQQIAISGTCQPAQLKSDLIFTRGEIRDALLGKNAVSAEDKKAFYDGVIGIDTAGPEFTCFTGDGMKTFKEWVRGVYDAAIERRNSGWRGKLIVHTHVGEGGVKYKFGSRTTRKTAAPGKKPQTQPVPLDDKALDAMFTSFPHLQADQKGTPVFVAAAGRNIKTLLKAVAELKQELPDLDRYVIFRFGHVTHADREDARQMKDLKIEADINLESNIATRAYWSAALDRPPQNPMTQVQQFQYNDLPGQVLSNGHAAEVLADHPLKYMLEAGVRTVMGSDGGGEEHSSIKREYELAGELITYWKECDPTFKPPAGLSAETLKQNAERHIQDMQSDEKID